MATGLASGEDSVQGAALSGVAGIASSKISNPILSSVTNEIIPKFPTIMNSIFSNGKYEE